MCNPEPFSSCATSVRVMICDHAVQLCTSCICGVHCSQRDGHAMMKFDTFLSFRYLSHAASVATL